jgi:hypothetical protein
MKRGSAGPILSTVFVDYDNVYLSLKRKNDDAAKRFAKDSSAWLQALIAGDLITPTSAYGAPVERRIALTRCYGNSSPRRNSHDNSTDMNSFPFVKHHFLRAGFEIIDCPPLTAQLKNSADIKMVMDIRDLLNHDTYFDEFIILSGDADFTPLLHRLRAHARRTVVFATDNTAQPYTALCDGEVREADLMTLLLSETQLQSDQRRTIAAPQQPALTQADIEAARRAIVGEVVQFVRQAPQAVPLETLADRAVRMIGREKTVGTNWGGFGSFRDLLLSALPDDIHLSDSAPYTVFDANRHISPAGLITSATPARAADVEAAFAQRPTFKPAPPVQASAMAPAPQQRRAAPEAPRMQEPAPQRSFAPPTAAYDDYQPAAEAPRQQAPAPAPRQQTAPHQPIQRGMPPRPGDQATQLQQSIARIHEACRAPALAPAEYRVLFDIMAQEINTNGLQGSQTLVNLTQRAREYGLDLKRDDLRFILEVVSESDPWFEQGASSNLFASRFRNFVVARCRSEGLSLSADELDLVEAWFSATPQQSRAPAYGQQQPQQQPMAQRATEPAAPAPAAGERWWSLEEGRQHIAEQRNQPAFDDEPQEEFPRIVRSRLRG